MGWVLKESLWPVWCNLETFKKKGERRRSAKPLCPLTIGDRVRLKTWWAKTMDDNCGGHTLSHWGRSPGGSCCYIQLVNRIVYNVKDGLNWTWESSGIVCVCWTGLKFPSVFRSGDDQIWESGETKSQVCYLTNWKKGKKRKISWHMLVLWHGGSVV